MNASKKQLVVCIKNKGHEASLERRKIYQALPDAQAARRDLIRVVDESGEDYLYPDSYFVPIELPKAAVRALVRAS